MTATLKIRDETTAGQVTDEFTLEMPAEQTTLREVLRSRVYQEVKDYNTGTGAHRGLVQPLQAERRADGGMARRERGEVDWKKQFDVAVEAFESNRLLVLVGDRQAESLDEEFSITPQSTVTFLRLVPLAGG